MNIPLSPVVLVTLILSAWATHAHANSAGGQDASRNSSAVDTSKVRAGASVTIVYGLGYRDPLSGEWPKLAIAKGTIQAVDGERVLLALEGRDSVQRIDLERIQGFDQLDAPSPQWPDYPDPAFPTLVSEPSELDTVGTRRRIVMKLLVGSVGGILSGLAIPIGLAGIGVNGYTALGLWPVGFTAGAAVSVSSIDPRCRFIYALAGSAAGLLLGGWISHTLDSPRAAMIGLLGPPVLSTMASEMWREKSEGIRLSAGLSPGQRGVSAVARMRF